MEKFKYVGKTPNSTLQLLNGEMLDKKEFAESERINFRTLFHNEVALTLRNSKGFFSLGVYENLSPQYGAFERLEETLKTHKYRLIEITRASNERNEFLCRVQMQVPTIVGFNDQLLVRPLVEGTKGYAHVSFYVGVCKEFTQLLKESELLQKLLVASISKEKEDALPLSNHTSLIDAVKDHFIQPHHKVEDEAFNPEKVIGKLINTMRLERRYFYSAEEKKYDPRFFYQSPEGFIYRIEIDGYSGLTVMNGGD